MKRLVINDKTFYEPVEIEIYDKTYEVINVTKNMLDKIEAMDKEFKEGNLKVLYDQISLFVPKIPKKVLHDLKYHELQEIRDFVIEAIFTKRKRIEKNESGQGLESTK